MPRKYTRRPLAERFWEKVKKTDTCWLWQARTMPNGYGVVGIGTGKTFLAHRVAYELTNGPIPDGMLVCHRCDVRNCVNPAHLFLGTHSDNTRDALQKGRLTYGDRHWVHQHPDKRKWGETNGAAKLTPDAVRAIRARAASGESHRSIAIDVGVQQTQVSRIVRRVRWPHIN